MLGGMNQTDIENMAKAVIKYLELPEAKLGVVREALQSQWRGRVAFVWCRADVVRLCKWNGWAYPSAAECDAVLTGLMLDATPRGVTEDDVITQIKEHKLDVPGEAG